MGNYYTLSEKEKAELLGQKYNEPYKMQGHSWKMMNGVGKHVCKGCGLVALNNKITDWCINKGCNYDDHPQYRSTLKRLTKME